MWVNVAAAEILTGEHRSSTLRRKGAGVGGDSFLSAQVSLAFPGVTDTQINPQDADSAVTIDWQQGIEAASPQIPRTAQTSNPLLSAGSSTSCLTGQTMREADKRERRRYSRGRSAEKTPLLRRFYNQPAAPPTSVSDFAPPSLLWWRPITTRHNTSLLLSILGLPPLLLMASGGDRIVTD